MPGQRSPLCVKGGQTAAGGQGGLRGLVAGQAQFLGTQTVLPHQATHPGLTGAVGFTIPQSAFADSSLYTRAPSLPSSTNLPSAGAQYDCPGTGSALVPHWARIAHWPLPVLACQRRSRKGRNASPPETGTAAAPRRPGNFCSVRHRTGWMPQGKESMAVRPPDRLYAPGQREYGRPATGPASRCRKRQ